ncbi:MULTISPECIES: thiamine pyrophosphate-binding protein [unclassified Crossiella]|uniref:thiamine pyrophosphate-binding protein n=1 Tax=unclassified Crossiella TaxID=2620835 RepID=UPI0020001A7C|nr:MULTISPECIES: thiamine pyrophosphate-binding protein [unclassified Crossiella]MCK2237363.1 thiamine pyrophosphate-binding protein [Crossiella sp. S99.2]MCK2251018.1 thiamine pyrophosphate-binding protein [Crossiella sp. S99.1]
MRMTGGQALVAQLLAEGVRDLAGVPHDLLRPATEAIARTGGALRCYTARHEQAAARMADGYARASGRIGVCLVGPGAGVLDALSGLATAHSRSTPVLLLAGQVPSHLLGAGLGLPHELPDQSGVLAALTTHCALARRPEQVPAMVRTAVRALRTGRPRPVALELPPDVLAAEADIRLLDPGLDTVCPVRPDQGEIEAAAKLLRGARKPVLYAGWGVQAADADAELLALAETLGAPVVTSLGGPGAIPGDHPLAFPHLAGRQLLRAADVVLAVGARFLESTGEPNRIGAHTRLVLLNADEHDLGAPREPDVTVHADARLGLAALTEAVGQLRDRGWPVSTVDRIWAWTARELTACGPQLGWVSALRKAIPADGVLVDEVGPIGCVVPSAYPVLEPRTFLAAGQDGGLGGAFATALGAKLAQPDRPVVALLGDGVSAWNPQELATAKRYRIGVVTVVFNENPAGVDFLGLAKAFGVRGFRASDPDSLCAAVAQAINLAEPALVEVPTGPMPSPGHLVRERRSPRPAVSVRRGPFG